MTNLYWENSSADQFSNRLEWRGFMELSPRLSLLATASATQSHHNAEGTALSSAQTALTAAIPGTGAYVLAAADETLTYALSQDWTLLEGLGGGAQVPVFDSTGAKTYQGSARLRLERLWEFDAGGLETRARYVAYRGGAVTRTGAGGNQAQLINELVGTWRHDWSYDWASRAEAGVAHVELITRNHEFWQPVGLLGISYFQDDGEAELTYRHGITTSVFLGLTYVSDELRLHGSIPLDKHDRVYIAASAGYQRSRILDAEGDLATHLKLALGDVAVGYRILNELELSLRYQHVEQISDADLPPLPLTFARNTVLATATLSYPAERDMPRTYREPQRVDQSDAVGGDQSNPTGGTIGGGPPR
jgi:hypothetical protein